MERNIIKKPIEISLENDLNDIKEENELPSEFNQPNTLRIHIHQAKDLKKSAIRSTISSYVKLLCGKFEKKTCVMSRTTEPKWEETFTFRAIDWTGQVTMMVADKVNIRKRFLGQIRICTSDLQKENNKIIKRWYTLKDKNWENKEEFGSIEITAEWIYEKINDPILYQRNENKKLSNNLIDIQEKLENEDKEKTKTKRKDKKFKPSILLSKSKSLSYASIIKSEMTWDKEEIEGIVIQQEDETEDEIELRKKEHQEQENLKKITKSNSIKTGDYQIQVHIIEARDLKGEDASGSSDPVCIVEIMGKKKSTNVKKNMISCVFDETLFFNFKNIGFLEMDDATIKISVMDSNILLKNTMIGLYQFDLISIYFKDNHEIYRQWIGLADYDSKDDKGIQGYLLLSITILGPGDTLPFHDRQEERAIEFFSDTTKENEEPSCDSLVLLPPTIEQKLNFLVVSIYKAENLPTMDSGGLLSSPGIDAYVRVDFAGNPKCKSSTVTVKGTESLNPIFLEELWIPIMVPTMSKNIELSIYDYDRASSDELVGRLIYNFHDVPVTNDPDKSTAIIKDTFTEKNDFENISNSDENNDPKQSMNEEMDGANENINIIINKKIKDYEQLKWIYFYGPPLKGISKKNAGFMNKYANLASTYRGRLLVNFKTISNPKPEEEEIIHVKDIEDILWENKIPKTTTYTLRCVLLSGSDIPKYYISPLTLSKTRVNISIGNYNIYFDGQYVSKAGTVIWGQSKEKRSIILPSDLNQLPDICITLDRQIDNQLNYASISFIRLKASTYIMELFDTIPLWYQLIEEKGRRGTKHELPKNESPGSLLMKIGFGREEIAARKTWQSEFSQLFECIPCQIRIHIYQCKGLCGNNNYEYDNINPFICVKFNGTSKETIPSPKRKHKANKNMDPLFYETIIFDTEIPKNKEFSSQIVIKVINKLGNEKNHLLGYKKLILKDVASIVSFNKDINMDHIAIAPRPKWYKLESIHGEENNKILDRGEILLSVQCIELPIKRSADENDEFAILLKKLPLPLSIMPQYCPAFIEIITIGLRNLKSYNLIMVQKPFIEFELTGGTYNMESATKDKNPKTKINISVDGRNANFLERIIVPVFLPNSPLYCPQLKIKVYDARIGGLQKPLVGRCIIDLCNKMPWNKREYIPPQRQEFHVLHSFSDKTKSNETSAFKFLSEEEKNHSGLELHADTLTAVPRNASLGLYSSEDRDNKTIEDKGIGIGTLPETLSISVPEQKNCIDPAIEEQKEIEKYRCLQALEANALQKGFKFRPSNKNNNLDITNEEIEAFENPSYYRGRDWWMNTKGLELEKYLKYTPFEKYNLSRCYSFEGFNTNQITSIVPVGQFKGLVSISEDDPSIKPQQFIDFNLLRKKLKVEIRLYILNGSNLQPKHRNGLSNPYIKIKLGKKKVNDRDYHKLKTLNPEFYRSFRLQTVLPGTSELDISVWDYDRLFGDKLIGSTIIDLEDRWFHNDWQAIGQKDPNISTCGSLKPIEIRQLWTNNSSTSQGTLTLWVDMIKAENIDLYPMIDIKPPEPQKFEIRVIIWKSEDVIDRDMSEVNDLYVTCWMEGLKSQSTDVHWRCSTGRATWNWRLKFEIELPLKSPEYGRLHVQLWDKDIIKWNDVIGETQIDLYKFLYKAYKKNETIYPFKEMNSKDSFINKNNNMDDEISADSESDDIQENDNINNISNTTNSDILEKGYLSRTNSLKNEKIPLLNEKHKKRAKEINKKKDTKKSDRTKKKKEKKDNEVKEALGSILDLIGMGRLNDDAGWLTMYYTDREQGSTEKMGKIALSIQIVPIKEALAQPVGKGREEPNINPFLPPPVGRMKLNTNPLLLMKEIIGPKACAKLVCICCCMSCIVFISIFGAGIMSTLTYLRQK